MTRATVAQSTAANADDVGVHRIRLWLKEHCGIDYPERKIDLLRARIQRVAERFGIAGLRELSELVVNGLDDEISSALVQSASTNHTYFFREPAVLQTLKTILPSLAAKGDVRIWSAAASTGDEAYTVAIMAAELLGIEEAKAKVSILGTDISAQVIAVAERGIYGQTQIEHASPSVMSRYFRSLPNNQFEVREPIKSICTFRRLNLKTRPWPFRRPFNVILCRNVLYYFDRDDQRATLEAMYDAVQPEGYLLTSVTETVRDLQTRWDVVGSGIYRSSR